MPARGIDRRCGSEFRGSSRAASVHYQCTIVADPRAPPTFGAEVLHGCTSSSFDSSQGRDLDSNIRVRCRPSSLLLLLKYSRPRSQFPRHETHRVGVCYNSSSETHQTELKFRFTSPPIFFSSAVATKICHSFPICSAASLT